MSTKLSRPAFITSGTSSKSAVGATKSLVHALVTSRLDYCNSLLYGCKTSSIKRLQRIQNYSARAICKIAKYDYISPVLKQLHWLPVKTRIEHKLLTLTFKAVHGQAPSYLSELISRRPTLRPGLRSNHSLLFTVPKITSRADKSTADRAFSLSAPKLWNPLPEELRNCSSVETFKGKLKTFFVYKVFLTSFILFQFLLVISVSLNLLRYRHFKNFIIIIIIIIIIIMHILLKQFELIDPFF